MIYLTFNPLKPNQSICLPASATRTIMMETLWRVDVSQLGASQRLNIYYFGPIRLDAIDPASQRYLRSWKWRNGKGWMNIIGCCLTTVSAHQDREHLLSTKQKNTSLWQEIWRKISKLFFIPWWKKERKKAFFPSLGLLIWDSRPLTSTVGVRGGGQDCMIKARSECCGNKCKFWSFMETDGVRNCKAGGGAHNDDGEKVLNLMARQNCTATYSDTHLSNFQPGSQNKSLKGFLQPPCTLQGERTIDSF